MGELSLLSGIFIALGYISALIFFGGLFYKLWGYATTPSPLNIPITPQPKTVTGVVLKNFRLISTFESLFIANKWTWVGGYALHLVLLFVLLGHLRYIVEPLGATLTLIQPLGMIAGLLMPLPLIYLWVHRKTVDRLNYITSGADIFALALLLLIALSGITLRLLYHPDVAAVKEFMLGLVLLSPVNIPSNPIFLIHFSLVVVLGIYFPFSKLLHAGGIFFSPTRTQVENAREVRYVNPWASSEEKS
jgi:nitrate reductase gamma subunit